jgi:catechol 2,3-dioxygenase-like lactoylglutathione lyase family enzyme
MVYSIVQSPPPPAAATEGSPSMELGVFSISLAVKNLAASRSFYEKLGFEQIGGDEAQNYLIMQNGDNTVGLFHGMFEDNILTFNPGWNSKQETLDDFTDVRDLQAALESRGVQLTTRTDETGAGPASIVAIDPDGNPILIDQHVPRPGESG